MAASGPAAAAPSLPPLIHWRTAFWLFGLVGLTWCVGFALWFRKAEEKASVNEAELARIRRGAARPEAAAAGIPWARILLSRNLWAVCAMYGLQSFGWYFYITYLPRFLEEQFAVPSSSLVGALYKGGPLWMGALRMPDRRLADRPLHPQDGKPPLGPPHLGRRGDSLPPPAFSSVWPPPRPPGSSWPFRWPAFRPTWPWARPGPSARTSANAMRPSWPAL